MSTAVRSLALSGLSRAWSTSVNEASRPSSDGPSLETLTRLRAVSDPELVAAFLAGERDAFDVIVERHRRQVYQLCYRFLGNHEDASDLTQDVFVRAFKGLRNFKGDAQLGTCVNTCLNRLALKQPRLETIEPERHVEERNPDAHELVARDERAVVVRRAIARLPPKQRATLVLRMYQEMSHQEIAGVLGTSVGAVKANFFHALGNLKRLLQATS